MMKSPFDQIEQKIKELFEHGSIVLPWMDSESVFLHHLTEAIHTSLGKGDFSVESLPDSFTFYLCPQDAEMIESQHNWQDVFYSIIHEIALEYDLHLEKNPSLRIVSKNSLTPTEVRVKISADHSITGQTNAVPIGSENAQSITNCKCLKCSLLLEDESSFPLDSPVINIGRKSSNHLVIDDLRVSRNHAQIRAIENGFMIFDTGSSGGTYINGERITQRQLKSGDVISLAGIKLIFFQEQASHSDEARQITSEVNTTA